MNLHTLAVLFTVGAASSAAAQSSQLETWFQTMDADGNGQVTLSDVQTAKAKQFSRIDRNDDGALTSSEIDRVRGALGRRSPERLAGFNKLIGGLDGNDDGIISRTEYVTTTPVFLAADRNNDNVVSKAEMTALAQAN